MRLGYLGPGLGISEAGVTWRGAEGLAQPKLPPSVAPPRKQTVTVTPRGLRHAPGVGLAY